jgi:hypothetical protein
MARRPVLPNPDTDPAEAIPQTMEAKIRGAMMHFTPFKKTVRKGFTYAVNSGAKTPIKKPAMSAIKIHVVSFRDFKYFHIETEACGKI